MFWPFVYFSFFPPLYWEYPAYHTLTFEKVSVFPHNSEHILLELGVTMNFWFFSGWNSDFNKENSVIFLTMKIAWTLITVSSAGVVTEIPIGLTRKCTNVTALTPFWRLPPTVPLCICAPCFQKHLCSSACSDNWITISQLDFSNEMMEQGWEWSLPSSFLPSLPFLLSLPYYFPFLFSKALIWFWFF